MIEMNLNNAKYIEGWMTEPELSFLAHVASYSSCILEVGCFKGRSTRALADNMRGVLTCVDVWNDSYEADSHDEACRQIRKEGGDVILAEFENNLQDVIQQNKLFIFRGLYRDFNPTDKYDFIFIDANHGYRSVKEDITKSLGLLRPGGIIAGHDYSPIWPGVKLAVDELIPDKFVHDTIWYKRI